MVAKKETDATTKMVDSELFEGVLKKLRTDIPPELIKQRDGYRDRYGNVHQLDYVEWQTVADILDAEYPQWSHDITMPQTFGDMVVCKATITIEGISRSGLGTGAANTEMGLKKSEHDALKRAAVKFGVARSLYMKGESSYEEQEGSHQEPGVSEFRGNARAANESELASSNQLNAVRAIGRDAGVDVDQEVYAVMSVDISELSKKGASYMIDRLKAIMNGRIAAVNPLPGGAIAPTQPQYQQPAPAPYVQPTQPQYQAAPPPQQYQQPAPPVQQYAPVSGAPDNRGGGFVAASGKQLGMIRGIGRDGNFDIEATCVEKYGVRIADLSKQQASDLIRQFKGDTPGYGQQTQQYSPAPPQSQYNQAPPPAAVPQTQYLPPPAQGGFPAHSGSPMIKPEQIKAVQHYCGLLGRNIGDVAMEYSHGRTQDIGQLSNSEAGVAIQALTAMAG